MPRTAHLFAKFAERVNAAADSIDRERQKTMKVQEGNMAHAISVSPRSSEVQFEIERILVPLDFSSASKEALNYAVSLAKQFRAAIHLVHVYPPDEASSVPGAGHLLLQSAEAIQRLNEELASIHRKHAPTFVRKIAMCAPANLTRRSSVWLARLMLI
jgi:K+-sensing histidine kinase KdpD